MSGADVSAEFVDRVRSASASGGGLRIAGFGSKLFYGRQSSGEVLDVTPHRGIIAHEPADLVITARTGTSLDELDRVLAGEGQVLGFEPPRFGGGGSVGGAVASGLSGPRRPWAGAVRDFVLGVRCMNAAGDIMQFGGTLIKNVAGYDMSRLMAGSLGTLGLILEVSLRVIPAPKREQTRVLEMDFAQGLDFMNRLAGRPLPLSAACADGVQVYLRFSGSEQGVDAAGQEVGGEILPDSDRFWADLRDQRHDFFAADEPLWRISQLPGAALLDLHGKWLLDWGGAQRWLKSEWPAERIFQRVAAAGGHATLFRGGDRSGEVFQPLSAPLKTLHRRVKQELDPKAIFNPQRMYGDW